jgi:hypothetical protein
MPESLPAIWGTRDRTAQESTIQDMINDMTVLKRFVFCTDTQQEANVVLGW